MVDEMGSGFMRTARRPAYRRGLRSLTLDLKACTGQLQSFDPHSEEGPGLAEAIYTGETPDISGSSKPPFVLRAYYHRHPASSDERALNRATQALPRHHSRKLGARPCLARGAADVPHRCNFCTQLDWGRVGLFLQPLMRRHER